MSTKSLRSWRSGLVILALVAMPRLSDAAEREYAVSGAVYRGNEPDLGLSDLWLAALSKQQALKVLDRAQIRTILGELSLSGVGEDSARQVRLGGLLGVEYFAWLKVYDDQVLLEIVEAATGRGLAIISRSVVKGQLPEILPELAGQAVQAIGKPLPGSIGIAPSVAFSVPRYAISNDMSQLEVEKLITELSGALANSGVTVLSRRVATETVQERWRQEQGLVTDVAGGRQFLGADYVFGITSEATNRIELIMVEAATGRHIGKKEIPLKEIRTLEGLKAVKQWGVERLQPMLEHSDVQLIAVDTNSPHYAAPEILKSLYDGIVLHNQGRYLDAIPLFEESRTYNMTEDETDAWIDNCYRLAGFPEIADDLGSDFASIIRKRGLKKGLSLKEQTDPGVALLGITTEKEMPRGLAERTSMLVIDSLYKVTGAAVFTPEAIAGLRDEYDLLLGLENVKGTTWQKAPPILTQNAVTAHLARDDAGIKLRLCLVRNSNPTSIFDVVTSLPDDHMKWQTQIDIAANELLSRGGHGRTKWSPPEQNIVENQQQLLAQLEKSFNSLIYLKALARDPCLTKYRGGMPWPRGMDLWFLRTLPAGHPERTMLEFETALYPIGRGEVMFTPSVYQQLKCEFRKFSDKYPNHLVGLYSRYNLLLMDMTPTNFDVTEKGMHDLLARFEPLTNSDSSFSPGVKSIRKVDAILRFALDLPGGEKEADKGFWRFNFSTLGLNGVGKDRICRAFDQYIVNCPPVTSEQMQADLSVFCFQQRCQLIPAKFFRDIIEKNGPNSQIAAYVTFRYFGLIEKNSSIEDMNVICPVYAASVCEMLDKGQYFLRRQQITEGGLMAQMSWWPKSPVCETSYQKIRLAIEQEFPKTASEASKLYEESWVIGPLKDHAWLKECRNVDTDSAIMKHYFPYLERLHKLFDGELKTKAVCRLYGQFASSFFRASRYDLAEPLLEQIISWKDSRNRPPESQSYVQSLYLLALLKLRSGDKPGALRLAKEAEVFIDAQPEARFRLLGYFGYKDSGGNGWTEDNVSGPLLRARVTSLIKELRENPQLSFVNPYL